MTVQPILDFYGADKDTASFKLHHSVWQAAREEFSGSSGMVGVKEINGSFPVSFPLTPLARVYTMKVKTQDFFGYEVKDQEDGYVWLKFGTDCQIGSRAKFVFIYTPKPEKSAFDKFIGL